MFFYGKPRGHNITSCTVNRGRERLVRASMSHLEDLSQSAGPVLQRGYDCFLTHDWGDDEEGRSNHARVCRVGLTLKAAGLKPWLDEERMRGDINQHMVDGIEKSRCIVIFITSRYLQKAWGKGPGGDDDNCKFEVRILLAHH